MTKRDKIDQVVESVGKVVSNLQQTTLDEVIHSVRYNFEYYRIHATLNYYSNSRNPRVIQARFKNQKLTTLRTNPHDPYYTRPGEFLTLAKKRDHDKYYDDVLSYYVRSKSQRLRSAPSRNRESSGERRSRSRNRNAMGSSRSRYASCNGSVSGSRNLNRSSSETCFPKALRGQLLVGPDGPDGDLLSWQNPRCTLYDEAANSKKYCPVHLTPHRVYKDFKISHNGQVTTEQCLHLRSSNSKLVKLGARSSSNSRKKYSKVPDSIRSVSDTTQHRNRSSERRRQHNHGDFLRSQLEHGSRPVSEELQDQHRHTTEILAMLNEVRRVSAGKENIGVDSGLPFPRSNHKTTRKIKRKLVKRTNGSQGTERRSDHSVVTPEVCSNLIDMSSIKDASFDDLKEPGTQEQRSASMRHLVPPPLPVRPLSHPVSRKVLGSSLSAGTRGSNLLGRIDKREAACYSDSVVKKSLRFQEIQRDSYSRPNTRHVFRTASLRNLSKDPQCHCRKCVGPKPWQITMSDVSLTAARLSTGSDRMSSASLQQRQRLNSKGHDAFAESFKEARARCNPLVTMSILDSYYDY